MDVWRMFIIAVSLFFGVILTSVADNNEQKSHHNKSSHSSNHVKQWQQIIPPDEIAYTDLNGVNRNLQPSCSGQPVCETNPNTGARECQVANKQFSFFVREGQSDKLAIMFDGGGACWDSINCIAFSSFNPNVAETVSFMNQLGGAVDANNPANPLKDWSIVFIPYCTGDIHWGSSDTQYTDHLGMLGEPGETITIHHRGWDNFLSVMSWLEKAKWSKKSRKHIDIDKLKNMDELMVMGSSAGAYGALFAFPYLREVAKHSEARLLIDGGNGVVNDDFLIKALGTETGPQGNWNVRGNLPTWIPNYEDNLNHGADIFAPGLVTTTANYYQDSAIGQYTTAWDGSQIVFLNIMKNLFDPANWRQPALSTICEWHGRMTTYADLQSSAANYRYYIAAGLTHTILANPDNNNLFYEQDTAGLPFTQWLKGMLKWENETIEKVKQDDDNDEIAWENAKCVDCQTPFDPALCGF